MKPRTGSSALGRLTGSARPPSRSKPLLVITLCLPLLGGCAGGDMEDLRVYSQEILKRKSRKIEPLPEIKLYEVYAYGTELRSRLNPGEDPRDPFEPFFEEKPEQVTRTASTSGIQPDFDRNREELESFPLDSLRMVGTVEKDELFWGIIRSGDGTIYRVKVGNYMGRNHGKITTIMEDQIELTEIIPDGLGGWQERAASLALVE